MTRAPGFTCLVGLQGFHISCVDLSSETQTTLSTKEGRSVFLAIQMDQNTYMEC